MYWWTSMVKDNQLHHCLQIQYLNELRPAMWKRHVPLYND